LGMQMLNEEGKSLSDVKDVFGHADIRSTGHYAEMLPGRRAELMSNRGQVLTQESHKPIDSESLEKLAGGRGVEHSFTPPNVSL
jgi:hypothetical protein